MVNKEAETFAEPPKNCSGHDSSITVSGIRKKVIEE
jgi:hypothetical protein